jgi:peptidoglycan/LPS O-acetylase OafA/YrhL
VQPVSPNQRGEIITPSKRTRFAAIDGLRGLAALAVVLGHVYESVGSPYPDHLLSIAFFLNSGVDLFFVISGFCLFYPLTSPGSKANWRVFYFRRARRLLPPYYVALAAVIVLPLLVEPALRRLGLPVTPVSWAPWRQIWTHALFLHTLFRDTYYNLNGPLWSLALEWQFYLAFPLAVFLLRRLGWRAVILIGMITVGYRVVVTAIVPGVQQWNVDIVDLFPSRWLEFVLGMLVALQVRRRGQQAISRSSELLDIAGIFCLYFLAAFILYGPLAHYPYPQEDLLDSLLWSPLLLLACTTGTIFARIVAHPVLVWLGIRSYSLYLIHLPILFSLGPLVAQANLGQPASLIVMATVGIPLSLICTALFFQLFERPFLNAPDTAPVRKAARALPQEQVLPAAQRW